jgi:hypothetical protein
MHRRTAMVAISICLLAIGGAMGWHFIHSSARVIPHREPTTASHPASLRNEATATELHSAVPSRQEESNASTHATNESPTGGNAVRFLDDAGRSIANVNMYYAEGPGDHLSAATSNRAGIVQVMLKQRSARAWTRVAGFADEQFVLSSLEPSTRNVVLKPEGTISGRVLTVGGDPIGNVTVLVLCLTSWHQ